MVVESGNLSWRKTTSNTNAATEYFFRIKPWKVREQCNSLHIFVVLGVPGSFASSTFFTLKETGWFAVPVFVSWLYSWVTNTCLNEWVWQVWIFEYCHIEICKQVFLDSTFKCSSLFFENEASDRKDRNPLFSVYNDYTVLSRTAFSGQTSIDFVLFEVW